MTDVSPEKFNVICRLCMSTLTNGAQGIFEDNNDSSKPILKKITFCLQLQIENEDRFPKSICGTCSSKLDEFYSYRQLCLQTEVILLKSLPVMSSSDVLPCEISVTTNENNTLNGGTKCDSDNLAKQEPLEATFDGETNVPENNSDVEMSPPCENIGMSEDDDDEIDEKETDLISPAISDKSLNSRSRSIPELAEPSFDDYVLMKEETFKLDPIQDLNVASRSSSSRILADYLIEFSNSKNTEPEVKDKDILELQRLRREILPPMWDVYEKSVLEKENITSDGTNFGEKERQVTVTHRRYIINKGAFPCSLCGECFEFDQGKRRDDFSEDKSKLYDCLTCGKVFPRRSSWKRHQSTHEDIKPYVCRICNKGFNRKEHLNRHILSHGNIRPYSCSVCSKQFVRKEHLTRHQLCNPACAVPVDSVLRPFGCDVCSQGFVRKEHLLRHRKRAHDLDAPESEPEAKPFTCHVCTKTFTRREHLKRHQLIHQRDITVTALGNRVAATSGRLLASNANMKDEPTTSELSISPSAPLLDISLSEVSLNIVGNEDTKKNDALDDSRENECGDSRNAELDTNEGNVEIEDDPEDPLPPIPVLEMNTSNAVNTMNSKSNTFCNVCFKNFSRRSHLLRHMKRIHSMQLPPSSRRRYQPQNQLHNKSGDENGNSLTDSASVNAEQIFKCQLCGKVFSRKSHLERHEKNIHQILKGINQPYECVTCGETFVQSKLLNKHMQMHGNAVPDNYVWM